MTGPARYECGIRVDSRGWPERGDDETEIGRWHLGTARLFVDMVPDPDYGAYVRNGCLGLLVTDKSLRGTFYEGQAGATKLGMLNNKFTFYWPFEAISGIKASHYRDNRRPHVIVEDSLQDGHLGMSEATIPKGRSSSDFLSPVLSMKDRVDELYDQLTAAHRAFLARSGR